MILVDGIEIKPTVFPDGTQQVWHLPEEVLKGKVVVWDYEHDSELMIVCQLGQLLGCHKILFVPFLPYGRQDKPINNESCFGLRTFIKIVSGFYKEIQTIDAHSEVFHGICGDNYLSYEDRFPTEHIRFAVSDSASEIACYPDKGAMQRYGHGVCLPSVSCRKVRDQATGAILSIELDANGLSVVDKNVLIIDDIIDGGRTFMETAKLLKSSGAAKVFLYGTHALCSKGVDILHDSGIEAIYSCEGLKSKR
jgi:ribose-phosphate pyrophosphokinase